MNTHLHWLDIRARIDYKLCVTTFRCLNGPAPRYLARHCTQVSSVAGRAQLRSAASGMLVAPAGSTKAIGPRAFAVSGPCSWNNLPVELRCSNSSLASFKKELKTNLFARMLARQSSYIIIHFKIGNSPREVSLHIFNSIYMLQQIGRPNFTWVFYSCHTVFTVCWHGKYRMYSK